MTNQIPLSAGYEMFKTFTIQQSKLFNVFFWVLDKCGAKVDAQNVACISWAALLHWLKCYKLSENERIQSTKIKSVVFLVVQSLQSSVHFVSNFIFCLWVPPPNKSVHQHHTRSLERGESLAGWHFKECFMETFFLVCIYSALQNMVRECNRLMTSRYC